MADETNDQLKAIARLEVQLQTVLTQLSVVSSNMVTKDLYTAQNANVEYRFSSQEQQITNLKADTTKAQVELDAASRARHETVKNTQAAFEKEVNERFEKQEERAFQIEQSQKEQKNSRWTSIGVTILGGLVSVVASVVIVLLTVVLPGH